MLKLGSSFFHGSGCSQAVGLLQLLLQELHPLVGRIFQLLPHFSHTCSPELLRCALRLAYSAKCLISGLALRTH